MGSCMGKPAAVTRSPVDVMCAMFDTLPLNKSYSAQLKTSSGYSHQKHILNFTSRGGQLLLDARPKRRTPAPEFLRAVVASLDEDAASLLQHNAAVKPLRGANTRPHTDRFRGGAPNACMFLDKGASLVLRKDVQFRTTVVQLHSQYYVPLSYTPAEDGKDCILLLGRAPKGKGDVERFLFDGEVLDELKTVGELDCIVVGSVDGHATVLPKYDPDNNSGEQQCSIVPFDDLVKQAHLHATPLPTGKPTFEHVSKETGKGDSWVTFEGWRFLHFLEGDPNARRVHIVNRAREPVDGLDFLNPNFTDCRTCGPKQGGSAAGVGVCVSASEGCEHQNPGTTSTHCQGMTQARAHAEG